MFIVNYEQIKGIKNKQTLDIPYGCHMGGFVFSWHELNYIDHFLNNKLILIVLLVTVGQNKTLKVFVMIFFTEVP